MLLVANIEHTGLNVSECSHQWGEEDIEKEACFILGLLAIKSEHQHAIADAGALTGLVRLLKRWVWQRINRQHISKAATPVLKPASGLLCLLSHSGITVAHLSLQKYS